MIVRYRVLAERIELELALLGEIVQRCEDAMERAARNVADRDFYVAAAALNLHDFYNGLERVFEIVAAEIDETVPSGSSWHRDLLTQMTIPLRDVRPPVLTRETAQYLDQYSPQESNHPWLLWATIDGVCKLIKRQLTWSNDAHAVAGMVGVTGG